MNRYVRTHIALLAAALTLAIATTLSAAPAGRTAASWHDDLRIGPCRALLECDSMRLLVPISPDTAPAIVSAPHAAGAMRLCDLTSHTSPRTLADIDCTHAYSIVRIHRGQTADSIRVRFTTLPVIAVSTHDSLTATDYTAGTVRITSPAFAADHLLHAKFRLRGGSTQWYQKRSFNMKLTDEQGKKLNYDMLGMRSENSWILDGMAPDRIRMHNRVCFDLWNSFSRTPYPTEFDRRNGTLGRFVELIFNGSYHGIYCLTDKIDRKLLALAKSDKQDTAPRGLLYQGKDWDITSLKTGATIDSLSPDGRSWSGWQTDYPSGRPTPATWEPLKQLCSFGSRLAHSPTACADSVGIYYYTQNLVDFYLLVAALNLADNGNKNCFISQCDAQQHDPFLFTPWDMDCSLGGWYNGMYYGGHYDTSSPSSLHINRTAPFRDLWNNNIGHFRTRVADRWFELRDSLLSADTVAAVMTRYALAFKRSNAWQRELERWAFEDRLVDDVEAETRMTAQWYRDRTKALDAWLAPYRTRQPGHAGLMAAAAALLIAIAALIAVSRIRRAKENRKG